MTKYLMTNDEQRMTNKNSTFLMRASALFRHWAILNILASFAILAKSHLVGTTGVEPALPKELEPKSSASANSATSPYSSVSQAV